MPMRHVDPDAGWPAEDIELLVCPGCRCGLAGSVLWALRQVPPSGELVLDDNQNAGWRIALDQSQHRSRRQKPYLLLLSTAYDMAT